MNVATDESWVDPASRDSVKAIISIAGSAREAIIISRLEPIPPKLVPTSSPANASMKRALPRSATIAIRSTAGLKHEAGGERRHQRCRHPGRREDHVRRGAKEP